MDKSIAMAMLGTFTLTFVDDAKKGTLKGSAFIGILVGFLLLSFLAGPMPEVAKAFAWLVFVVTALSRGPNVLKGFSG